MGDKLSIAVADLSKESISDSLSSKNISQETINHLLETLDHCEFARFAPTSNLSKSEIYKNAESIIIEIEQALDSAKHKLSHA